MARSCDLLQMLKTACQSCSRALLATSPFGLVIMSMNPAWAEAEVPSANTGFWQLIFDFFKQVLDSVKNDPSLVMLWGFLILLLILLIVFLVFSRDSSPIMKFAMTAAILTTLTTVFMFAFVTYVRAIPKERSYDMYIHLIFPPDPREPSKTNDQIYKEAHDLLPYIQVVLKRGKEQPKIYDANDTEIGPSGDLWIKVRQLQEDDVLKVNAERPDGAVWAAQFVVPKSEMVMRRLK